MEVIEDRLSRLEEMVMRLLYIQQKTEMEIQSLSKEMKEFKQNTEKMIAEMKESNERFKIEERESNERFRLNVEKMIAEMNESTERFKQNTEKMIAEMNESTERFKQNTEKMIAEMKEDRKKLEADMNKRWGELANKMGTLVEDIIFPATKPVLEKYFNCEITDLGMNIKRKRNGLKDEFDVIAVSEPFKTVFLIEVKSTPKVEYINDFKNNKIKRFKDLYPEYNDYKLIPIMASLRIEDDILNYLTKNGIYGMAYREWEYMDILNFDQINEHKGV